MILLNAGEIEQTSSVIINWWELWPVYVSAAVSVAGAITAFFAPKAVERLRHKLATKLQEKQHLDQMAMLKEQHALEKTLSNDTWIRDERRTAYTKWLANVSRIEYLLTKHRRSEQSSDRISAWTELRELFEAQKLIFAEVETVGADETVQACRHVVRDGLAAVNCTTEDEYLASSFRLTSRRTYAGWYMSRDMGIRSVPAEPLTEEKAKIDHLIEVMTNVTVATYKATVPADYAAAVANDEQAGRGQNPYLTTPEGE